MKTLPKHLHAPLFVLMLVLVALAIISVVQGGGKGGKPTPLSAAERAPLNAQREETLIRTSGGISPNLTQQQLVARVAQAILTKTEAQHSTLKLRFHLLAEPNVINVYGFTSGNIYVTTGMVNRLHTEGELAAVLAHEASHVLNLQHMELPAAPEAQILRYTMAEETKADTLTLKLMADAGYNPEAYLSLYQVLTEAYQAGAETQFFTSHPSTNARLTDVNNAISQLYPQGVPTMLSR